MSSNHVDEGMLELRFVLIFYFSIFPHTHPYLINIFLFLYHAHMSRRDVCLHLTRTRRLLKLLLLLLQKQHHLVAAVVIVVTTRVTTTTKTTTTGAAAGCTLGIYNGGLGGKI
jgi:hypothetical protein